MGWFSSKPKPEPNPIQGWQPTASGDILMRRDPDGVLWTIFRETKYIGRSPYCVYSIWTLKDGQQTEVLVPYLAEPTLEQTIAKTNAFWSKKWPDTAF